MLENDASGAQTEKHQKRMMTEIAKLLDRSGGKLAPADYDRTVAILLSGEPTSPSSPGSPRAPGRTR